MFDDTKKREILKVEFICFWLHAIEEKEKGTKKKKLSADVYILNSFIRA